MSRPPDPLIAKEVAPPLTYISKTNIRYNHICTSVQTRPLHQQPGAHIHKEVDNMDYGKFAEHCIATFPEYVSKRTGALVERIEQVFGPPSQANFNNTDLIPNVFYVTSSKLSNTNFYHIKRMLKLFYSDLYEEGLATKETVDYLEKLNMESVVRSGEVETKFFKDLQSAIAFIRTVGHHYQFNDSELLQQKAIVILSWLGIDEPQDLKKSQIRDGAVYLPNKVIRVGPKEFAILEAYRDLDTFRTFPYPRSATLLPSEWLFRGPRRDHLTKHNLMFAMQVFNECAADFGKNITLATTKINGLFDYVRTHRTSQSVATQIYNRIGTTRQIAFGYEKTYKRWMEVYWKGE